MTSDSSDEAREQRGVDNPRVVDLIQLDPESGEVVLFMLEERAWGTVPEQLHQLEAKFNSYLSYVLDGHLVTQYPQYADRRVRIRLDCAGVTPAARSGSRPTIWSIRRFSSGSRCYRLISSPHRQSLPSTSSSTAHVSRRSSGTRATASLRVRAVMLGALRASLPVPRTVPRGPRRRPNGDSPRFSG